MNLLNKNTHNSVPEETLLETDDEQHKHIVRGLGQCTLSKASGTSWEGKYLSQVDTVVIIDFRRLPNMRGTIPLSP